jgi:hypothetical protein
MKHKERKSKNVLNEKKRTSVKKVEYKADGTGSMRTVVTLLGDFTIIEYGLVENIEPGDDVHISIDFNPDGDGEDEE